MYHTEVNVFCVCKFAESMAQQLDRSMRDTVRQTGKRPREAYTAT